MLQFDVAPPRSATQRLLSVMTVHRTHGLGHKAAIARSTSLSIRMNGVEDTSDIACA